jgi:hypothetical protein
MFTYNCHWKNSVRYDVQCHLFFYWQKYVMHSMLLVKNFRSKLDTVFQCEVLQLIIVDFETDVRISD